MAQLQVNNKSEHENSQPCHCLRAAGCVENSLPEINQPQVGTMASLSSRKLVPIFYFIEFLGTMCNKNVNCCCLCTTILSAQNTYHSHFFFFTARIYHQGLSSNIISSLRTSLMTQPRSISSLMSATVSHKPI